MCKMKYILFADDDLDDRELLLEAFVSLGKENHIEMVSSGKALLQVLEEKSDNELPSVILVDYNIPDINGAKIIKAIHENKRYSHIIKIIWSTSNSKLYKSLSFEAGANYYFEKPQSFNGIIDFAESIMNYCK